MALLFIHGVRVREHDPSFEPGRQRRADLLEHHVVTPLSEHYPQFAFLNEVYWGDLGVRFRCDPGTISSVSAVAPGEPPPVANTVLERFLIEAALDSTDAKTTEDLFNAGFRSYDVMLVNAAKTDPAGLVHAAMAYERDRLSIRYEGDVPPIAFAGEQANAELEGHLSSRLLRAGVLAANDEALLNQLRESETADQVRDALAAALTRLFDDETRKAGEEEPPSAEMGPLKSLGSWVADRISAIGGAVSSATRSAWSTTVHMGKAGALATAKSGLSASSPYLSPWIRDQLGPDIATFLGDAFEYLRRGQGTADNPGKISESVQSRIVEASEISKSRNEPLVIVTHSFGSMICYDLLTSVLTDVPVALWVMAGSQVSVFAAMHMYRRDDDRPEQPYEENTPLGKPDNVREWINFYHATDLMSFKAEEVFGSDAVTDEPLGGKHSVLVAHGAYFNATDFYETIAKRILCQVEEDKQEKPEDTPDDSS